MKIDFRSLSRLNKHYMALFRRALFWSVCLLLISILFLTSLAVVVLRTQPPIPRVPESFRLPDPSANLEPTKWLSLTERV